jgi:hypothetical protein
VQNTVQIKIFDDMGMDAVDQELFSFATDVHGGNNTALRQLVNVHIGKMVEAAFTHVFLETCRIPHVHWWPV